MVEERAVTDIAMTLLRRLSHGRVQVALFTQNEEANTGADFELVLIRDGHYLSYLIQAKALKPDQKKEGYPALGEKLGGVKQYDRLLNACAPGQRWEGHGALHVFYNSDLLRSQATWPGDRCLLHAADHPARGITAVPTSDLVAQVENGRRSYRYDRIAPACWPWWCFFCCSATSLGELAMRTAGGRPPGRGPVQPVAPTDHNGGERRSRLPEIRDLDEAPDYVQLAVSSEGRRRILPLEDAQARPASAAVVTVELDANTND